MSELLTLKKTETQAACCTVFKYIYSGALPAPKVGNCWRTSVDDLTTFVKARQRM